MPEDWVQATLAVPPLASEAASDALFESGAGGVWEDSPDILGRVVLKAGYPQGSEMRLMAELPAALMMVSQELGVSPMDMALTLELKPGEDYAESWKRDLAPIEISPSLVISPSWWDGKLPGERDARVLRLDPGSAFGSGHHPTTFLCLRLACDLAERSLSPQAVLDLGSGSGVLALSAALLWPKAKIAAIDNDPDTIYCAKANLMANNLSGRFEPMAATLEDLTEDFDLILANLTRNVILELARELGRKSAIPGRLIISGLLEDQAPDVIKALALYDFVCDRHLGRAEWSALSFARGLPAAPNEARELVPEPEIAGQEQGGQSGPIKADGHGQAIESDGDGQPDASGQPIDDSAKGPGYPPPERS
jgi:ribosomal protein L11 methyltransferase